MGYRRVVVEDIFLATSKKVITKEEWEKKLNDVQLRKEDMNKLVMNFLVTEGYVDAAEKFRMESGTEPDIDLATITDRMAVKKAVQCGNVEDAIEKTIGEDTGWWCHNVVEDTVWGCHNVVEDTVWGCHNGVEDTGWRCQTDVEDSLWGHVGPL
ncbi:hypothetical protein HYC85_017831 [Camellia sinensis]|uniref:LisH domain-containing protein n=1 Tax=Camellia sinensis TaxID=4442 RepID=A0A7J7GWB5_CAMSI|nr:hypothetical protein HYC85_017831 [Camellia sinensis]